MSDQYQYITLSSIRSDLANRLGDSGQIFWSPTELNFYIQEALRAFNVGAQFHRTRVSTIITSSNSINDLADNFAAECARNYSVNNMTSQIKYHLMESQTQDLWSDQFTQAGLVAAMNSRQNQFLFDTGQILSTLLSFDVPAPSIGRIPMPDTLIDVRRVVWKDEFGNRTLLWRTNEYSETALSYANFFNPGAPQEYSVSTIDNLDMQLYPSPIDKGQLDLIIVSAGNTLDPDSVNPDNLFVKCVHDFGDAIKWGTMADLLNQSGPGNDSKRAQYCESRYQDYVTMAKVWPTVINGLLNNSPCLIQALNDVDIFTPTWEVVPTQPTMSNQIWAMENLYGAAPMPDSGTTPGITFDLIQNAPLPFNDGDFIQLPIEALECTLGYAAHLALFKVEGPEFEQSLPLYQAFVQMCTEYNSKLRAEDFDLMPQRDVSEQDERKVPRRK